MLLRADTVLQLSYSYTVAPTRAPSANVDVPLFIMRAVTTSLL